MTESRKVRKTLNRRELHPFKSDEKLLSSWPSQKERGTRHRVKGCKECPDAQKKARFDILFKDLVKIGPSRSKLAQSAAVAGDTVQNGTPRTGCLQTSRFHDDKPACTITLSDSIVPKEVIGRCGDGSYDRGVWPRATEKAVLEGIGCMEPNRLVVVHVALHPCETTQISTFSRLWTSSRTVLHLPSNHLVVHNLAFLVADGDLLCENMVFEYPNLQHLRTDSKMFRENGRSASAVTDCKSVRSSTVNSVGRTGSSMTACKMCVEGDVFKHDFDCTYGSWQPLHALIRIHDKESCQKPDSFPNLSLLDLLTAAKNSYVKESVEEIVWKACDKCLLKEYWERLRSLACGNRDAICVAFPRGHHACTPPLLKELFPELKFIEGRLENCSVEQKRFLKET